MAIFGSNPVFDMLKKDHENVKVLFEQFEQAEDARTKQRIIRETIQELDVHAKLEELLIYPAIRKEIDDKDVMDEALEEHHVAHVLLNELKRRVRWNLTDRLRSDMMGGREASPMCRRGSYSLREAFASVWCSGSNGRCVTLRRGASQTRRGEERGTDGI
jgi:Hemerythrin HHE cation binding domain